MKKLQGWVPEEKGQESNRLLRVPTESTFAKNSTRPESALELELREALSKPAFMAPSLERFVNRVFADPMAMRGDEGTSTRVYSLYSESLAGPGATDKQDMMKRFYLELWGLHALHPCVESAWLQYLKPTTYLKQLAVLCKQPYDLKSGIVRDFLYFEVTSGIASMRVYLNVKLENVRSVVLELCNYINYNKDHGVLDFKVVGPASIGTRADSIVIYCKSLEKARAVAERMKKFAPSFDPDIPAMTELVVPGLSLGAEPKNQWTSMEEPPDEDYAFDSQSFGSIRSQLIAMAILSFRFNEAVLGRDIQTFRKFVCIAFRSYGLDPMRPGLNSD